MKRLIILYGLSWIFHLAPAHGVGNLPVPHVTDVSFNAQVIHDSVNDRFIYQYNISSAPTNQGDIAFIFIDITRNSRTFQTPPADFHFSTPIGFISALERMDLYQNVTKLPFGTSIETISTDLPPGWGSSPTADGHLLLTPPEGGVLDENGVPTHADLISPGESISGLTITALTAPTLREVIIVPDWELVADDPESLTDELIDQGNQVFEDILIKQTTIGPGFVNYGGGLLTRVIADVDKMIQLGWITDIPLMNVVQTLLKEANNLKAINDGTLAKVNLQQVINLMAPVNESQMRREAIDLIRINTQLVFDFTPDTFIRPELVLTVQPQDSVLEIGDTVIFDTTLIDRARNGQEVPDFESYSLVVLSGPHTGLAAGDSQGTDLGYTGTKVGTDIVEITRVVIPSFASNGPLSEIMVAGLGDPDSEFIVQAKVTWTGGPDYVISFFSPPSLDYEGAESIWIYEETKNIGNDDGLIDTKTRYYLSATPDLDISTAYQLQERSVGPLVAEGESKSGPVEILWPDQFGPGQYYFAACVDANNEITELNENNNCSFHQVDQVSYVVGIIDDVPDDVINVPPNCDSAVASLDTLWPPNHKFKTVGIDGVFDADHDEILVTITAITQDEPVDSVSSGSTSPDGKGVGTTFAQVRAERDGTGDGRVYAIHFKAADTFGNECTGIVNATSVVHDQGGQSQPAVDSGQVFDSTIEFN